MLAETFLKNHLPKILFSPNSEGRQVFCETRCFVKSTYTQKNLHKKLFFFLEYRIQEAAHQRQTVPSSSKLWRTGERTLCAGFAHSFVANGGPRTIKKGPSWRFGTTFLWATRRRSRERESWLGRPRAASHSLQGLFALITLQPSKVIVNYTCLWCSYLSLPLSLSLLFVFHFFIFFSSFLHIPKNSRLISCSLPTSSHMLHHFMDLRWGQCYQNVQTIIYSHWEKK